MNKLLNLALLAALVAGAGCVTTESGKKVLDENKIANFAAGMSATASAAVGYAYNKNTNILDKVVIIRMALNDFLLSTNLAPNQLEQRIFSLPIQELKKPEAILIVTPVLAAYKSYAHQYVRAGIDENVGLRILIQSMIDGIDTAIVSIHALSGAPPEPVPMPPTPGDASPPPAVTPPPDDNT